MNAAPSTIAYGSPFTTLNFTRKIWSTGAKTSGISRWIYQRLSPTITFFNGFDELP